MNSIEEVEDRRNAILAEMSSIRGMRRGTINRQFLKVPQKGKREPARRGPYYVFSRRQRGKTVSQRLRSAKELEEAREGVAQYNHFVALCKEFEELTERLGELERRPQEPPEKNGGSHDRARPGSNAHLGAGRPRAGRRSGSVGDGVARSGAGGWSQSVRRSTGRDWVRVSFDFPPL